MPLEVEGVTGAACDPCATAMLGDIRRQSGWAYHLVVSRTSRHLFDGVSRLLEPWPHVKVVVDRRYVPFTHATPPAIHPYLRQRFAMPPRRHYLVIRRDCAHLYEDLAPLFSSQPDIRVLVDRRNRSRTPSTPVSSPYHTARVADPPAWLA